MFEVHAPGFFHLKGGLIPKENILHYTCQSEQQSKNMKRNTIAILSLAAILGYACEGPSENKPEKWSVRMANTVIKRNPELITYNNPKSVKWQYDIAMVGHAVDRVGNGDTFYSAYMKAFYDYFVQDDGTIRLYAPESYNLDHVNPAKGLITLYKRTGEEKYLKGIKQIINQLENQPRISEGGFWHKKIYPWQMWLDGLYMSSPFMAEYAHEFNEPAWLDSTAKQITLVYEKTLDPQTGLLYHAYDESRQQAWCDPETGKSKEFWGRAMGWYMMALVDALDFFPEDHPRRQEIIDILNKVSEALMKVRDPEAKVWYQVLDKGGREGNYLEGSCSAMFTYAFAKGARKGYLPSEYLDIARESFEGMLKTFIVEEEDGTLTMKNICGAAGLGGNPYRDGTYEYYVNEIRVDNDPKGVGPFIFAALELEQIDK